MDLACVDRFDRVPVCGISSKGACTSIVSALGSRDALCATLFCNIIALNAGLARSSTSGIAATFFMA